VFVVETPSERRMERCGWQDVAVTHVLIADDAAETA
jgi:hypothetical protein